MMQIEFEAALRTEGYEPAVPVEKPVGYSMGEHQHPFDAFALITQGSLSITVGGQERFYQTGDVFRLAANTLHSESAAPQGVSYLAGRRHLKA
jgi:quercetin dioxygenase-like cupin family protein